jgi:hypothetical protein
MGICCRCTPSCVHMVHILQQQHNAPLARFAHPTGVGLLGSVAHRPEQRHCVACALLVGTSCFKRAQGASQWHSINYIVRGREAAGRGVLLRSSISGGACCCLSPSKPYVLTVRGHHTHQYAPPTKPSQPAAVSRAQPRTAQAGGTDGRRPLMTFEEASG